ncbi:MAG: hypothetical protein Q8R26_01440 [bacterium]|nr:hypothetical protein [bacterium]
MATVLQEIDQKNLERDIRQRFDKLSDALKAELSSEKNYDAAISIANGYNLTTGQRDAAPQIVGEVLLGYLNPNDIAQRLSEDFNVEETVARSIQRDLIEKIFTVPIRVELEKFYKPLAGTSYQEQSNPVEKSFSVAYMPAQPTEQKRAADEQVQKSFRDFLKPTQITSDKRQVTSDKAISTVLSEKPLATISPRPPVKIPVTMFTPSTAGESTNPPSHKASEGLSSPSSIQQAVRYSAKENKKSVNDDNVVDLRKFIK